MVSIQANRVASSCAKIKIKRKGVNMNPRYLTNSMINKIGTDYCTKYPEKTWLHHHQNLANELKEYNKKNSAEDKWKDLLAIYSKLEHPNGELAQGIDQLFMDAFNLLCIRKSAPARITIYCYPTSQVVDHLTKVVKKYFSSPAESKERSSDEKESLQKKPSIARSRQSF